MSPWHTMTHCVLYIWLSILCNRHRDTLWHMSVSRDTLRWLFNRFHPDPTCVIKFIFMLVVWSISSYLNCASNLIMVTLRRGCGPSPGNIWESRGLHNCSIVIALCFMEIPVIDCFHVWSPQSWVLHSSLILQATTNFLSSSLPHVVRQSTASGIHCDMNDDGTCPWWFDRIDDGTCSSWIWKIAVRKTRHLKILQHGDFVLRSARD